MDEPLPEDRTGTILRALSNPVRVRLLSALQTNGPARVVDLADMVDEPANSVSFHLRQLGKAGLARKAESVEGANRKESWWESVTDDDVDLYSRDWTEEEREQRLPALRESLTLLSLDVTDTLITALESEARDDVLGTHQTVRLTEEEAEELRGRIQELVQDVTSRSRSHSAGDGSRPWLISTNMAPDLRGRQM